MKKIIILLLVMMFSLSSCNSLYRYSYWGDKNVKNKTSEPFAPKKSKKDICKKRHFYYKKMFYRTSFVNKNNAINNAFVPASAYVGKYPFNKSDYYFFNKRKIREYNNDRDSKIAKNKKK